MEIMTPFLCNADCGGELHVYTVGYLLPRRTCGSEPAYGGCFLALLPFRRFHPSLTLLSHKIYIIFIVVLCATLLCNFCHRFCDHRSSILPFLLFFPNLPSTRSVCHLYVRLFDRFSPWDDAIFSHSVLAQCPTSTPS